MHNAHVVIDSHIYIWILTNCNITKCIFY